MVIPTLTPQEIKCLRKHLKPLLQILEKLDQGAEVATAPKLKKETKTQGVDRYLKMIDAKESKKLGK